MRFRQYVNKESTHTIRGISIDHIIDLFEKNCKPYFDDFYSIWKGEFFISGRKSNEVFTKKKVRKDRKPKDTPMEIHEWIDEWFYKKFGIKARSNSIFCSFNEKISKDYGNPYYIIPIGKYSTIASPTIEDLFDVMENDWGDVNSLDYIKDELEKGNYQKNKNVNNDITEYMLHCNEYYMFSVDEMTEKIKYNILKGIN